MTNEETIAALRQKIETGIESLISRLDNAKDKWVIASEHHVFVGSGNGINGIGFDVRGVAHETYPEYPSFSDALRNIDPYLIDGRGNPIYNKPMKASEFYIAEIRALRMCLTTIQGYS